jgi:hypothetical protein
MALTVTWEADKRAVLIMLDTPWTFLDFQKVIAQAHTMIRTVQHPVDLIMWHQVPLPSRDMMIVFRDAFKKQPDNIGRIIVIPNKFTPFTVFMSRLAELFEKLYPGKSKMMLAKSIEEARSLIKPLEGIQS